jgi:hypothetical protein
VLRYQRASTRALVLSEWLASSSNRLADVKE